MTTNISSEIIHLRQQFRPYVIVLYKNKRVSMMLESCDNCKAGCVIKQITCKKARFLVLWKE